MSTSLATTSCRRCESCCGRDRGCWWCAGTVAVVAVVVEVAVAAVVMAVVVVVAVVAVLAVVAADVLFNFYSRQEGRHRSAFSSATTLMLLTGCSADAAMRHILRLRLSSKMY